MKFAPVARRDVICDKDMKTFSLFFFASSSVASYSK